MTGLVICFPLGFLHGLNSLAAVVAFAMKPSGEFAFQAFYSSLIFITCTLAIIALFRARHTPSQLPPAVLQAQYQQLQQQALQSPPGYGYAPPPGWQHQLQTPMPPQQAIGPLPPPPTDQQYPPPSGDTPPLTGA